MCKGNVLHCRPYVVYFHLDTCTSVDRNEAEKDVPADIRLDPRAEFRPSLDLLASNWAR